MVYVTQLDIFSPNVLIKSMLIKSLMSCNRRELYIKSLYMYTSGKRVGEVKNYLRKERMQLHIS